MYQNNASFFVRQFQNNMLRKQANFPLALRTVNQIAKVRPALPMVRPTVKPPVRPWIPFEVDTAAKHAPNWLLKYGVPAAAATAAAGGAAYGVSKLTEEEDPKERIKRVLYAYAPYVGGGAAIGALLGGGIGYANDNTLLGSLGGTIAGAGLGATAKYLYDRYNAQA